MNAIRFPLLLDFPDTLQTERLLLRLPRAGDGAMVHAAVAESITDLRRFLGAIPWVAEEPSEQASELFCRNGHANAAARKDFPFLLLDRASGAFVGVAGLHRPDWAVPKIEVGYWCRSSRTGHGLMTEAVRAVTAFAFDHLQVARVDLVADEENHGSRGVALRAGFTLEGMLRHDRRGPDGSLRNTCLYGQLAGEPA